MSSPLRILVALDSGADRDAVEAVLPVESSLELDAVVEGLEASWDALQRQPADLVLVGCATEADYALSFVDGITRHFPEQAVIVLHPGAPNGFVGRAFEAGAEDVVSLPLANGQPVSPLERERVARDILLAIEKARARRQRGRTGTTQGRMVTVLGPKGGAGKTLTACNLAVALAEAGQRVALVDLDLQFGDVALALGLSPAKTIHDLARSGGSLDEEKLSAYLVPHESGLRVLMAPTRPDQAAAITPEFLRGLYDVLKGSEEWVIVDTAPGFTPDVIASVDASTDVCMVGALDALSLKNTKLGLEAVELMGFDAGRIKVILNRADSRVGITGDDVEAVTGRAPDVLIPSHRDIPRSVNEARPIVRSQPRSDAARALRSLAEGYLGMNGGRARRRLPFGR